MAAKKELKELLDRIANENDPQQMVYLMRELNQILEERDSRLFDELEWTGDTFIDSH
jgi:hypothetical protein